MTTLRFAILRGLYGTSYATAVASMMLISHSAQAQAQAQPQPAAAGATSESRAPTVVEQVNVVGTRRLNASATDTVAPVDVIPLVKASETGGNFDLAQTLANISPSFNSTRQTGADGADLVDSAALRGLGSDQTLVLLNGKRRHSSALVNLFGARNRGNTGTDFNTIPALAVDTVTVLRDGAAAQYGSDAIAGVIDVTLKKRKGCEAVLSYGQYTEGDGKNYLGSAYCGFGLANGGVVALTGEYLDRGRSNRAEPGNPRTIGDSAIKNGTFFLNGEMPTVPTGKLYFTLGLQTRDASSGAFARSGVTEDPADSDIPVRNSLAMYPKGFVPFINGDIADRSAIVGHKMQWGEWNIDLSQTYGFNDFRYNISNTLNASIANRDLVSGGRGISPTRFDAGGFSFQQATSNVDVSRFFPALMGGTNVAFGAEYRNERYKIFAGEPGSYIDADGPGFGGNAGSQGFPGFQPVDATNKRRNSVAGYIDLEVDVSQALKFQTAVRGEHYSDFGSTVDGKVGMSLKVSNQLLLRGSASTGFRAPSLQQAHFSSTFTDFISGEPLDVVLAPNGSAVASAAGIPKLKEEKSTSLTFGATFAPSKALSITADLYNIDIKDRIVLSGRFNADNFEALAPTLRALGVGEAQFFVNSVKTRTTGIDFTAAHRAEFGAAKLNTFLGYNYSKTEVKKINTPPALVGKEDVLLSERERLFIEQGGPRTKATLTFDYSVGQWGSELKFIHYGKQVLGTFSGTAGGVPNQIYRPKTSADLSLSYALDKKTKLTVGGTNIFNVKPTSQDANETDNGFKYESVQFGLNGAAFFAKIYKSF